MKNILKNPAIRLFYTGIFGLGFSLIMILGYISGKVKNKWELIIGITLAVFSLFYVIASIILQKKK